MSSLLAYVCEIALKGRESEISEQAIGTAVFGRPVDYDSSIDGIVRTQASRLRQKLDLYFDGEGVGEPVRIVIPKGGYVPFFVPRISREIAPPVGIPTSIAPFALPPDVPPEELKTGVPPPASASLAWGLVAILAVVILVMFFQQRGTPRRAAIHPLWSQTFVDGQRTLIVPGDSGLVMWQGMMNRNVGLAEYIGGDYRAKNPSTTTASLLQPEDLGNRRYTSIVDLQVVQALTQIAQSNQVKPDVRYARDLRPDDLKQSNVILIGATEANPWVELFEHNMNFVFFRDHANRSMSVVNRSPKDGEPGHWDSSHADSQRRVYGAVAYLPNLSGTGNALIFEGTSMAGT